jgi:hypothetical protein
MHRIVPRRCDVDIRKDLYAGLVLTGGTAGFAALRDRLEKEVAELAPQMAKVKVSRGPRLGRVGEAERWRSALPARWRRSVCGSDVPAHGRPTAHSPTHPSLCTH